MDYLRAAGLFVAAVPNGEARSPITGARLKGQGVLAGMPDLWVAWASGGHLWIEMKARSGSLSPLQRSVHAELARLGHRVVVARSLDDIETALRAAGAPLKARMT